MMNSTLGLMLRACVLLGTLAALPLLAAGGLSGPDRWLAQARQWWDHRGQPAPLVAPRLFQVELPTEALQYRDFELSSQLLEDDENQAELSVVPAAYETTSEARYASESPSPQQNSAPASWNPPTAEQALNQRLHELGVIDSRIEAWGHSGQLFRFQAVVGMEGSGNAQRVFQAINTEPLAAAQEVIQQIELALSLQRQRARVPQAEFNFNHGFIR